MIAINKQDQKSLAIWAADCAGRVLPFFEKAYPKDDRPRKAIRACRRWVRTGVLGMADIRKASLAAHAAARQAKEGSARFAARAAGQAVATAHVPQHAFGAAYYALKIAANSANPYVKIELRWQTRRLPKNLRQAWQEWQSERLPKYLKQALSSKVRGSAKTTRPRRL